MTDIALNMKNELIPLKGKTAPEVTHGLKSMGQGTMIDGLIQRLDMAIAEKNYFEVLAQSNLNKGLVVGGAAGLGAGLAVGLGLHTLWSKREERRHREKIDFIKDTYSQSVERIKKQVEELKAVKEEFLNSAKSETVEED